jgi:protein involved in polysaccharide export with SLBB domain
MNVAIARFSRLLLLFVVVVGVYVPVRAQNVPVTTPPRSTGSSSLNLDLKFDEALGNTFYVDMLGLEASQMPFAPEVRVDPTRYILGPNDLIGVIIRGALSLNYRAIGVNVEGDIILPSVGTIRVAGLNLVDARDAIRAEVEKGFRNVTVQMSLDKPRPMSIHITGDIPYPGRVSVPYGTRLDVPLMGALMEIASTSGTDLGTPTKALYPSSLEIPGLASTEMGSEIEGSANPRVSDLLNDSIWQLRSIQINKLDGSTFYADLYDYYYGGNLDANPILYDGDRIQISILSDGDARVSISGAVKSPIELPYREDDTIEKLLRIAGGYTSNADVSKLNVFSLNSSGTSSISVDVTNEAGMNRSVEPNDRLIVPKSSSATTNTRATVVGHAQMAGMFPIVDGVTTAYDLMQMAGGSTDDALSKAAYITRSNPVIRDLRTTQDPNLAQLLRGSDQYVEGLNWFELEEKARQNRIYFNVDDEREMRAIRVFDGDSLIIPRDESTVFVYGQVAKPGITEFKSNQSALDYIAQAGGFSISANRKNVYLIKAGSRNWVNALDSNVESGDWIYVDRVPLDDLAQRRLFRIQRQGLYTAAFTALVSAVSTTIAILIYYKN